MPNSNRFGRVALGLLQFCHYSAVVTEAFSPKTYHGSSELRQDFGVTLRQAQGGDAQSNAQGGDAAVELVETQSNAQLPHFESLKPRRTPTT